MSSLQRAQEMSTEPPGLLPWVRARGIVVLDDGASLLDLGPGRAPVVVDAVPDAGGAARRTAGLRRRCWQRILVGDGAASAVLDGSTRRPVRTSLPLPAALALLELGLPTFIREVRP